MILNRFCNLPHPNWLCACSKTGFVPTLNQPLQNRLYVCSKTNFVPSLNLLHQNRLCIGTKPAFSFWINISTASEVRCDCQGLGLVARIEASIFVFDTKHVLYRPVLAQIQFCSFDRRCKTCLDTKPVLYQGRFCSLTDGETTYKTPTFLCLTLKYTFNCVYWWTRQRIHNTLIVVDRYLRLMGDKMIPDSAEPRLESFNPPFVAGIDLPHPGVVDSYNPPFVAGIDLPHQGVVNSYSLSEKGPWLRL